MPNKAMPPGALLLLILKVLRSTPLHGYAIAQRIHTLSSEVLKVEEGAASAENRGLIYKSRPARIASRSRARPPQRLILHRS